MQCNVTVSRRFHSFGDSGDTHAILDLGAEVIKLRGADRGVGVLPRFVRDVESPDLELYCEDGVGRRFLFLPSANM